MPHSSEGERAVAGSGEQERALAGSSKGGRALLRSPDYPCTARLRLRRLLAYLRRHSYEHIYNVARDNLVVIFDVRYLVDRVMLGMWGPACKYLNRFVDPIPMNMSYESRLLLGFLRTLIVLRGFANGKHMMASSVSNWFVSIYGKPVLAAYPCLATVVADVLFMRTDHARDYLEWNAVENKASEMVKEMAYKVPELKNKLHFPRGPNKLHHVVSIGSSFRQRRVVKNLGRQRTTDIARFYLQRKKRLPSSSQGESNGFSARPSSGLGEALIALLEKALQAGRCCHPPQYPLQEGEGFPLLQALDRESIQLKLFNTLAENAFKQGYAHIMLPKPSFLVKPSTGQGHQLEHSPKQDAAFSETMSAMKLMGFQESQQDAARPGTGECLNGPRTTNLS